MKFDSDSTQSDTLKSRSLIHKLGLNWAMGFTSFLVILLINALRVPSGLQNFWAEDGVVFYSDVLNEDFPKRIFVDSGGGGYLNLSGKLIAEFVGMFPIGLAPVVNFIFVNLVYAILFIVIYNQLHIYFNTKTLLFTFMGFFIFVPIASFDSVATSINLHFFLLFTSFILIFAKREKSTLVSHSIIFVTCLSDPLAILLIPAVVASIILQKNLHSYLLTFAFSLLIQVAFIFQFFGDSTRVIGLDPNMIKTAYLFMDRVVGSSLVPNWGFIDGQALKSGEISNILILRLVVSFLVLSVMVYSVSVARSINSVSPKNGKNFLVGLMLLTCSVYWSVASFLFNPEPRYAIFPSLCLVLIFLMSFDSIVSTQKNIKIRRFIKFIVLFLFISIFSSAFQVSSIRDTEQIWSEQIEAGKDSCKDRSLSKVELRIPPERNNLVLSVNCKKLR